MTDLAFLLLFAGAHHRFTHISASSTSNLITFMARNGKATA